MPNQKKRRAAKSPRRAAAHVSVSAATEDLLLAALARGDESLETGRFIVTYRDQAHDEGVRSLKGRGLRIADARDFKDQAVAIEDVGDADALTFPEIGVAVVGSAAAASRGLSAQTEVEAGGPIEAVEPEYFVFANDQSDYLRGFARAVETITRDLGGHAGLVPPAPDDVEAEAVGATWGLKACRVTLSTRSGLNIKVAVLDTGLDLGHPDFAGRLIASKSFVGQPVQDLHGHGTHTTGTACGPKTPPGTTPRYGIGYQARIFVGKVLSNSGSGATAGVLAGMNWAIANRCQVISMSLGAQTPVQTAYTAAGSAALSKGCLIIAAAGNAAGATGAPANSPTIMSVASLDPTLAPSGFSNFGKIEIAAPGRDVFSSYPRPRRYATLSGTSMATPHVSGCAALWAQTSTSLRGMALWRKLQSTSRHLTSPPARVGSGLVQAPR
jgi:subtilisin family serine protease